MLSRVLIMIKNTLKKLRLQYRKEKKHKDECKEVGLVIYFSITNYFQNLVI